MGQLVYRKHITGCSSWWRQCKFMGKTCACVLSFFLFTDISRFFSRNVKKKNLASSFAKFADSYHVVSVLVVRLLHVTLLEGIRLYKFSMLFSMIKLMKSLCLFVKSVFSSHLYEYDKKIHNYGPTGTEARLRHWAALLGRPMVLISHRGPQI